MSTAETALADLIDLAEDAESKANYARGLSENRQMRIREYQSGRADAYADIAKNVREKIAERQPKDSPALRLVTSKEAADV